MTTTPRHVLGKAMFDPEVLGIAGVVALLWWWLAPALLMSIDGLMMSFLNFMVPVVAYILAAAWGYSRYSKELLNVDRVLDAVSGLDEHLRPMALGALQSAMDAAQLAANFTKHDPDLHRDLSAMCEQLMLVARGASNAQRLLDRRTAVAPHIEGDGLQQYDQALAQLQQQRATLGTTFQEIALSLQAIAAFLLHADNSRRIPGDMIERSRQVRTRVAALQQGYAEVARIRA